MTPEIYISYAWRDREKDPQPDDREGIVDALCAALFQKNCVVRLDKTQVGYKKSIGDFMRDIGAAHQVVVVVSDKYLRSKYCMYEAVEILHRRDLDRRLFPVVLDDAAIHSAKSALEYVAFWENQVEDLERALEGVKSDTAKFRYQEELRDLRQIAEKIQDFMTWIADKNTLSAQTHLETRFQHLLNLLLAPPSEAVTPSLQPTALLTTPPNPEPVFQKLDIKKYNFAHALRPAQTKSVVAKLPAALNLVTEKGQGCFRMFEDFHKAGLAQDVRIIRIKLSAYLTDYPAFLEEIAQQGKVSSGGELVELLRSVAVQHGQPVLFILENLDNMYEGTPRMDTRYDIGFLRKMNALKNAGFIAPIVCSHMVIKGLAFQGQSSPFVPESVPINPLSYDDLLRETTRRLPDLPEPLSQYIADQLENDPNQTYDLLDALLQALDGYDNPSRDFIKQKIRTLRQNLNRQT